MFVNEVGMTPIEAIVANTSRNAWLIGLDGEIGVIASGRLAVIVIWDSDPTADMTVLQRPDEISIFVKNSRIVDRAAAGGFLQLSEELPRAGCWPIRSWRWPTRVRVLPLILQGC